MPYRIVREKLKSPPSVLSREVLRETISSLFPQQPWRGRDEALTADTDEIPEVTLKEVEKARQKLATGKAPSPDGVPPDVARLIFKRWPKVFQTFVTGVLREGVFPREWKRAWY